MTVRVAGIGKAFGGVPVLQEVDLELRSGRILGLVGENGAGKSTLMNILGGALRPDAGSMWVDGAAYAPDGPADARCAGIAFVHQELTLFLNLSIAENLLLLDLPRRRGLPLVDGHAAAARARVALDRVGLRLPPETLVEHLSAGERQLVEVARALVKEARVLILDEPTTSLGTSERTRLRALIAALRDQGLAQVFISHDLDDVLQISDEVCVLRDGRIVGHGPSEDFSRDALVRLMVGRAEGQGARPSAAGALASLAEEKRARPTAGGDVPALEVRRLTEPGVLHSVSLSVASGEIVGLFGLMGAGRSELARRIFGLERHASGEVLVDGAVLRGGPRERIARGLALVTEDRRADGLCLNASIAQNLVLASLPTVSHGPVTLVDIATLEAGVRRVRAALGISPQAPATSAVGTLSGGNQQKVVLGKWLMTAPRVLILDEPTRGIDVTARAEIYRHLRGLATAGAALLVISSDLEELLALADRLLVMRQGELNGEFDLAGQADDAPSAAAAGGRALREHVLVAALPEAGAR